MNFTAIRKALTLERVANAGVLLSVLVAFTLLCYNYAIRNAKPKIEAGLTQGQVLPQLSNYGDYPHTLLLVLNTQCVHCKANTPFYAQLIAADRRTGHQVHIVAAFPNDIADAKHFLDENQLEVDVVPNVNLRQLMIDGTPSLILLNKRGEVMDFWLGKVSPDQESQIMSSIFHL